MRTNQNGFLPSPTRFTRGAARRFELIDLRSRWGQWRVYYFAADGQLGYMPASWTDAAPKDPFVELAQGRARARVEDLLALAKMMGKECK
jgi:hypothetical protein